MAIGPSRLLGRFQLYLIVCIICIVLYASSECEMHYPLSMRCITLWVWDALLYGCECGSKERGFKGFELLEHWCWLWGGRSCTKLLTSAAHMQDLRLKTCLNVQVVGIHYTVMPMFWMHTRLLTRREGVTRHPHQVVDKEGRCYKASTPRCWQGGGLLQGIHTKVLMGGGGRGCYKASTPRCWQGGGGGGGLLQGIHTKVLTRGGLLQGIHTKVLTGGGGGGGGGGGCYKASTPRCWQGGGCYKASTPRCWQGGGCYKASTPRCWQGGAVTVTRHPHQGVDKGGAVTRHPHQGVDKGGLLQGIHTKVLTRGGGAVTRHPHQGVDKGGGVLLQGIHTKVLRRRRAVAEAPYYKPVKQCVCPKGGELLLRPLTTSQWSSVCAQKEAVSISVACQWPISGG